MIASPSVTFHYVGGAWEFPWAHTSCDDKVRGIQADHMDNHGWSDIAYNYLVCPHDFIYEGRGIRRSSANGSTAANMASYAICALWGTASADDPLQVGMKEAFLYGVAYLRKHGRATSVIKGHRDWKSTTCPGDQIYAWIKAGCPDPTPTVVFEDEKVNNGMALSEEAKRQIAQVVVACFDQEVKEGQSMHELVQMYSAFNAENVGQNKNLTIVGVDSVLANDFAGVNQRIDSLESQYMEIKGQQETIQNLLEQLISKP